MTLSYHFIPVSYIFVTLEKVQKKRGFAMICTPFTGQTSKGGIYYALLI